MLYAYTAQKPGGKTVRGVLNASDKDEAIERLLHDGMNALELKANETTEAAKPFWQREIGAPKDLYRAKIPKKKLLSVLNQMAIMLKAGVSLTLAMEVLIDSQKDKTLKQILQEINSELFGGTPISQAMGKYRAFPELIVSMVQAGEENGRLDTAFERCASIVEREITLTSKVRGAMGYPIFLLVLTIALMVVMNVAVLPNFTELFLEFDTELPPLTQMVMAVSDFLIHRWYILIAIVFAFVFSFRLAVLKFPGFRMGYHRFLLMIPLTGPVMRQSLMTRFCMVMSSLVEAGIDIVRALEISRDTLTNDFIRRQLVQVMADVKIGASIHASLSKSPVFDTLFISMVRVGEESGMLAESLKKMAGLYEQQSDAATKRLTTMLEPTMTIFIALIVGTVIISIVMPMFSMYSIIN